MYFYVGCRNWSIYMSIILKWFFYVRCNDLQKKTCSFLKTVVAVFLDIWIHYWKIGQTKPETYWGERIEWFETVIILGLIFKSLVFLGKELASASETQMFQPVLKSISVVLVHFSSSCFSGNATVLPTVFISDDVSKMPVWFWTSYSSVFCPGFSVLWQLVYCFWVVCSSSHPSRMEVSFVCSYSRT